MTRSTKTRSTKKKTTTTTKKATHKRRGKKRLRVLLGPLGTTKTWKADRAGNLFYQGRKVPKSQVAIDLIVVVYPDGHVGISRAERGISLETNISDARSSTEDGSFGAEADATELHQNLAVYQVPLVLAKPKRKPLRAPTIAKARPVAEMRSESLAEIDAKAKSEEDDEAQDDEAQRAVAQAAVRQHLSQPGEKVCAYPGCTEEVDDDDFCYGCKHYICSEHSKALDLGGGHEMDDHWLSDGYDDDDDESAPEDA